MAIQLSGSLSVLGGIETTGSVGFSYPEITGPKAWSAGGALITARRSLAGAGKTVGSSREGNSAIAFGGFSFTNLGSTEEYNGSTWSTGGGLIVSRRSLAGAGEVNAALAIGGTFSPTSTGNTCTEEYDGTTWSAGGSLINAMVAHGAAGTQDAGLAFGGSSPSSTCTEEYNGSTNTWSAGGTLTNGGGVSGAGTQNAALSINGTCTEEYDGSNWSPGGTLINYRSNTAAAGLQNAGIVFGGYCIGLLSCTEEYDGSNWTAGGALITARELLAGAGTQNAALAFGGLTPSNYVACTEEYAAPTQDTTTFNFSSTTGDISATGSFTGSFGGAISGHIIPDTNEVYDLGSSTNRFRDLYLSGSTIYLGDQVITATSYAAVSSSAISGGGGGGAAFPHNGSAIISGSLELTGSVGFNYDKNIAAAWSTGGALGNARYVLGGAGTQNAGLAFGGMSNSGNSNFTEEYNGSSWSGGGNLSVVRFRLAGAGTQDAGLAMGGKYTSKCTEEYNGASWSTGCAMIDGRYDHAGFGTQNAAVAAGGTEDTPSTPNNNCTEEYNGTSWSTSNALSHARYLLAGAGTQNAGLAFGGQHSTFTPSIVSCTEEYNGTSWSTGGSLITGRVEPGGAGTQNAGFAFGGSDGGLNSVCLGGVSCTEEYDGSTWTTGVALIKARFSLAGAGTQQAALAFGGAYSDHYGNWNMVTCTEEYLGAYTATISSFNFSSTTGEVSTTGSFKGALDGSATTAITASYLNGNITASGHIVPDTHEAYDLGSSTLRWRDLYLSGSTIDLGGTRISRDVDGDIEFKDSNSNLKKLKVEELILSSGGNETKIKINNGKVKFADDNDDDKDTEVKAAEAISSSFAATALTSTTATTASYAVTASHALNGGGGDAFPHTGSAIVSGSLAVTGSVQFAKIPTGYSGSGVWSTGGSLINKVTDHAGAGTQNAALAFGGYYGINSTVSCTEEYDGSSWSAGGSLNNGRRNPAGAGTQDAALSFGGDDCLNSGGCSCCSSTGRIKGQTEEYNGSSWSTGGSLIQATNQHMGAGTQNAALSFGGSKRHQHHTQVNTCVLTCTEEYDGSSWSAGGALITARRHGAGAGTQNAGLAFGGQCPNSTCTEEYNGTSWSAGGTMNRDVTPRGGMSGGGTQNDALATIGFRMAYGYCTELYDGISWSNGAATITPRGQDAMAAASTGAAVRFGGFDNNGSPTDSLRYTEEFNRSFGAECTTFNYSNTTGQTMIIPPTTDPGIAGALWNNNGTLSISAG